MNDSSRVYYSHATEKHAIQNRAVLMFLFLAVGLGIGTAVILLFAPSSGKDTRHNLTQNMGNSLKNGRGRLKSMMKWFKEEIREK